MLQPAPGKSAKGLGLAMLVTRTSKTGKSCQNPSRLEDGEGFFVDVHQPGVTWLRSSANQIFTGNQWQSVSVLAFLSERAPA